MILHHSQNHLNQYRFIEIQRFPDENFKDSYIDKKKCIYNKNLNTCYWVWPLKYLKGQDFFCKYKVFNKIKLKLLDIIYTHI